MARVNGTTVVFTEGGDPVVLRAGDEVPEWANIQNSALLVEDPEDATEEAPAEAGEDTEPAPEEEAPAPEPEAKTPPKKTTRKKS